MTDIIRSVIRRVESFDIRHDGKDYRRIAEFKDLRNYRTTYPDRVTWYRLLNLTPDYPTSVELDPDGSDRYLIMVMEEELKELTEYEDSQSKQEDSDPT